ncbi:MAG: hypothetical protein NTV74_02335 [Euryarchaeota archaeon]|nr:hypothetical protein [Euryarchaeota archaeon]
MNKNTKLFILVTAILVAVIITISLVFVQVMHKNGPAKIISVDIQPENPTAHDKITITVTTENASWCHIQSTYGASGYVPPIGNNQFQIKYGPTFSNRTIWFVVSATGNNQDIFAVDKRIEIGEIKINNTTNLTISNISHIPEIPDTSTTTITISADVKSDVNISNVELTYAEAFPYGSGGGGGSMNTIHGGNEHRYSDFIVFSPSSIALQKGTKIFYFITASDESGSTVITPTYSFTIF